jgi:predicted ester cyclase
VNEIPSILRAYIAGLKAHDLPAIAETVADDLAFVTPAKCLNKEQFLRMLNALYAGFPDWHYDHDRPERREEHFAVKWRQSGTHTGELRLPGFPPVPATFRKVLIPEQYFFYRIEGGKIIQIRPDPIPGGAPQGIFEQIGLQQLPG